MEFGSLQDAMAYIESSITNTMPEIAEEIKIIMDNVTIDQVEGWSGDIFNSVEKTATSNSAMASFGDKGNWTSLITDQPVGNPIKFLEAGTTWGRGASDIMDKSFELSQEIIPEKLKNYLIALGIPIE